MFSKRITLFLSLVGCVALYLGSVSFYTNSETPKKAKQALAGSAGNLPQVVQSPPIPMSPNFCGEPMDMGDFDQRERLDRELIANSYRHSGTISYLKHAPRFFPTIERILAEEGVPDDLKYLAVAESGLQNVKSSAGAKGYWQFMKATGKQYGLIIDSEIDERYHLEKSTRAACKYLKSMYNRFGSWTLAAAGYNMGGPNVRKFTTKQHTNSYYDLNINKETMRYVFRIVAIKEIMSNPSAYGFYIDDYDKYQPLPDAFDVEVKDNLVDWTNFAKKHNISYRKLKVYNPWIVDSKLNNKSKRTYYVKVPRS